MANGFVPVDTVPMMGMVATFLWIFVVIFIAIYIYTALVLMTIAKKTNTPNPWLAWIPVANLYLMTRIAGVPWWTLLIVLFAGFIPFIGGLVSLVITIWWWWKIAEARKKPGWFGILMLIPIVNLVIMGVIAWSD
jgi:hypothetical protein